MRPESAPFSPQHFNSLVSLLQQRAALYPERIVYRFLASADSVAHVYTYGEVDRRARAIAAQLQALKAAGERVLLLYPFGIDFITGFFGCLYAGAIAVPLYPPRSHRLDERLLAVAADSRAAFALTTAKIFSSLQERKGTTCEIDKLQWLVTSNIDERMATNWQEPRIDAESVAFLQYTSGSTGAPKGVMVSHANVLHNSALIHSAFGTTPESRGLMWTPFYHDMGLIGGVIQPLYANVVVTLLAPVDFLQQPSRWLQTISDERTTISGGPNFAYELCIQKITEEQCVDLDLASWKVAFCGAQPVRADTLERFTAKFAPYGFQWEAFTPCMGMAESTVLVSSTGPQQAPLIVKCNVDALTDHRVEILSTAETEMSDDRHHDVQTQRLVSSGRAWFDQHFRIVNPTTRIPCAAHQVGEIWIEGPSVAVGYWQRPTESKQTFAAYLADSGEGPFLRSGDLGFIYKDELFVTGRLKDLIIIRGRNYYPQDIEWTVERAHIALRPGGCAAFTVEAEHEEKLVIVQEVSRSHVRTLSVTEVINHIRRAVAQAHELEPYAVVLLRPGRLLKTSSGKVQRRANCQAFLQGQQDVVGAWRLSEDASISALPQPFPPSLQDGQPPRMDARVISHWLIVQMSKRLPLDANSIDLDKPFADYGLGSLAAVELVQELDSWLAQSGHALKIEVTDLWDFPTITALTKHLAVKAEEGQVKSSSAPAFPLAKENVLTAGLSSDVTPQSGALYSSTDTTIEELDDEMAQLSRLLNR